MKDAHAPAPRFPGPDRRHEFRARRASAAHRRTLVAHQSRPHPPRAHVCFRVRAKSTFNGGVWDQVKEHIPGPCARTPRAAATAPGQPLSAIRPHYIRTRDRAPALSTSLLSSLDFTASQARVYSGSIPSTGSGVDARENPCSERARSSTLAVAR